MWVLGPIGFTSPWLLLGLIVLPVLWLILRAVPPAPIRRQFPGVALLVGLSDDETQTDKTPWWLLLLRMLAVASIILAFAGPVLNPDTSPGVDDGPLLILTDGSWADARDWRARTERISDALSEAGRAGRPVAVVALTDLPVGAVGNVPFLAANAWAARLPSIQPAPYDPDPAQVTQWGAALEGDFDTFWVSSGLDAPWRADLLASLEARGKVRVFESPRAVRALRSPSYSDGVLQVTALRAQTDGPGQAVVRAVGPDPAGIERELARATAEFPAGEGTATVALSLPPELRNRVSRFEIEGARSAGAVALTDDALQRREVALISGGNTREGLELLDQMHYLRQALEPTADLIEGALSDIILANPDVIVFADVARLPEVTETALLEWINKGGLLVRFAGPRLAASDVSREVDDPLMPVRLRAGGRSVGGAMSWGEPKQLQAFAESSPFYGLAIPADVTVNAQVMAQPGPDLAERVIASLSDGTPLVTRKSQGEGQIVLFHVAANVEWSSLPLSGLFVQMLERLAVSSLPAVQDPADLAGQTFTPSQVLDGFGTLRDAGDMPGVPGEELATGARPGPGLPPGLYAGDERRLALNVIGPDREISATRWPARISVEGLGIAREAALKPWLILLAMALLAVDMVSSLVVSGRLSGARATVMAAVLGATMSMAPHQAPAQDDSAAIAATSEVVLAHVVTGDAQLDTLARQGLFGLSRTLFQRTTIEPAAPIAVNLETDELAFFPFLYWPVSETQPLPSDAAYVKLNRYLRSGGMILFDTRDSNTAYSGTSPAGRRLQQLALPLDIPPLEPIPDDHVLTRTFYLLQDFPGRYTARQVWVEAAPADAKQVDGMPFRNLNDNVTPVVIGGNDWAGAWAQTDQGLPVLPVGRGFAGERQRELAYRFGVNLIMHVLTGNYKSDQVHVPALLDRLGQ